MAGKTRVGELAKELGIAPKLIIHQLEAMGYKEKTSSSALDDVLLAQVRDSIQEKATEFAQRETERLEAARAASLRAKVDAVKAAAAKAARAATRKTDGTKPKADRSGKARGKGAPKTPERPAAAKVKPPERIAPSAPPVVPAANGGAQIRGFMELHGFMVKRSWALPELKRPTTDWST